MDSAMGQKRVCSAVSFGVKVESANLNTEVEGFFNLLYAHLFALYPNTKDQLSGLLTSISSTPANRSPIAYRVYALPPPQGEFLI